VEGFRARGGFTFSFDWSNGRLSGAGVISELGRMLRLRADRPMRASSDGGEPVILRPENGIVSLATEAGSRYRFETVR